MARKYKNQNSVGLRILCVVLALILAAGLVIGGLELWGTGKQKPSNWGKKNTELAPVTISLMENAHAPIGAAEIFGNGARAYPFATAASTGYPSTKRATATCTLPEGGNPDRYEWQITGGEGLSVKTVNSDGSAADVTAQTYFSGSATLTARAYLGSELRGIGSVSVSCRENVPLDALATLNVGVLAQFSGPGLTPAYVNYRDYFITEIADMFKNVDAEDTEKDEYKTISAYNKILENGADIIVLFDENGEIVQALANYTDLAEIGPFIVIDDEAYYPELVEEAGGQYLSHNINQDKLISVLNDLEIEYTDIAYIMPTNDTNAVNSFQNRFEKEYNSHWQNFFRNCYIERSNTMNLEEMRDMFAQQLLFDAGKPKIVFLPSMEYFSYLMEAIDYYGKNEYKECLYIILDLNKDIDSKDDPIEKLYASGVNFIAYERDICLDDFYLACLGRIGEGASAYFYQCDLR